MCSHKILVSNIQRFSLHDGPGIRTTVFTKGCSVHCPWCANPENISDDIEEFFIDAKKETYGKWVTCEEIFNDVLKDKLFYDEQGGITYSGGEPLLWSEELMPLMERIKSSEIHQCIETSLFAPTKLLENIIPYIDLFLIDIKILDEVQCRSVLGGDIHLYRNNLSLLISKKTKIAFRAPLIKPYTTERKNILEMIRLVKDCGSPKVELIKGHNLAEKKYHSLGKKPYFVPDISEEELKNIQTAFREEGIDVYICQL